MTDRAALAAELYALVLRRQRAAGGALKRATLARAIGVSQSSLYAYLNGTTLPPPEVLDRLLVALDVPAAEHRRLATARDRAEAATAAQEPAAPGTGPPPTAPAGAGPPRPVPRQLPADARRFTGRAAQLAELDAVLTQDSAVVTVTGGGGIGKTALALRWAHRNADRFPDGQLYADLRGFDPSAEPLDPAVAVARFLDALGVAPSAVPADPEAQVALYRSLLAGRRLLIVLDNARDAAQVAPLLPGAPPAAAIVTSRNSLNGLVATHDAHPLRLGVLAESRELLERHLGARRVAAEPRAVDELLDVCAGLPLAVAIVAGRAAAHPGFPLGVLAAELRAGPARLEGLELDDGPASLPAVLAASFRALDPAAADLLRLLGGVPGAEFEAGAVVSLYGENPPLRTLEDSSLLTQHAPGRYRMHDLVRLYAASLGDADALALRRFVDHYVHLAFRGDRLLAPLREPIALDPPTPGVRLPVPAFADADAAVAWFAREHGTLLAVQRLAVARGWYPAAWQLAWAMDNFHYRHGRVHDHVVSWEIGLDAASRSANGGSELLALRRMGAVAGRAGASGMEYLRRALDLAVATGDGSGQAAVHQDLAVAWGRRGDDGRALEHSVRAASLYRAAGDTHCEANALNNVGWFQARVGRHEEARRHCMRALALHRGHGDRESEAGTLDSLGFIAHAAGRYPEAVEHYTAALALFRGLDHGYGQASALCGLGEAHAALGHPAEARAAWTEALDLCTAQHRTADADHTRSRLATL